MLQPLNYPLATKRDLKIVTHTERERDHISRVIYKCDLLKSTQFPDRDRRSNREEQRNQTLWHMFACTHRHVIVLQSMAAVDVYSDGVKRLRVCEEETTLHFCHTTIKHMDLTKQIKSSSSKNNNFLSPQHPHATVITLTSVNFIMYFECFICFVNVFMYNL